MGKLPAIQFYPGDWLRDNVSGCSLAAQGLWLRILMLMHDCDQYGHLAIKGVPIADQVAAKRTGCESVEQYLELVEELKIAGVPSFTEDGIMFSRRLVRDCESRSATRDRVAKHRLKRSCNADVTPPCNASVTEMKHCASSSSSSSSSTSSFGSKDPISAMPPALASDELRDAWKEFAEMRRKIRAPLTLRASQLIWKDLLAMGPEKALKALNKSVKNSWRGVFDPEDSSVIAPKFKTAHERRLEREAQVPALVGAFFEDLEARKALKIENRNALPTKIGKVLEAK